METNTASGNTVKGEKDTSSKTEAIHERPPHTNKTICSFLLDAFNSINLPYAIS